MDIRSKIFSTAVATLASAFLMTGCSTSLTTSTAVNAAARTAPAIVTVTDAPLANLLSAKVTISALGLSTAAGSTVSVLTKPVTVELSGLSGVQEPVELTNLPYGTYTSATATVSAATVTYLDANGVVTSASVGISNPTVIVTISPSLTVSTAGEVHVQFGFNLSQSFDLTAGVVTFTPAVTAAVAMVENENGEGSDRDVHLTGTVVSVSATSITVQAGLSGKQFTFVIDTATRFPSGVSASTIQAGSLVSVEGQTQTGGTLRAVSISPASAVSSQYSDDGEGARGIIAAVTGSTGQVSAFTIVPRESYKSSSNLASVLLTSTTVYTLNQDALAIGLTAAQFTNEQIFPGQSVLLAGTVNSAGTWTATTVTLGKQGIEAPLTAAPQGSGTSLSFTLAVPAGSYLTTYNGITSLNVVTSAGTRYSHGMTASVFATQAAGTKIEVSGFLLRNSSGGYTLYAKSVGLGD